MAAVMMLNMIWPTQSALPQAPNDPMDWDQTPQDLMTQPVDDGPMDWQPVKWTTITNYAKSRIIGNCRYEHVPIPAAGPNQPANYQFADVLPYGLDTDHLKKDMTEDKPMWILSAYAPGKNAPEQLFGGYPREQSFEEVRLHYEKGKAAGNEQGALQEINALYNHAQQQDQQILNDLQGSIKFIMAAGQKHPNRIDECAKHSGGGTTGVFSRGSQTNSSQATSSSNPSGNPFLKPPVAPQAGAFGQTSALGLRTSPFGSVGNASAFGQPSSLGGQTTSAFGQPSQMGGGSAFGQPSAMGQNSAFGQTSALGQNSAFGQASTLGQKPNPFGSGGTSAFGQPSTLGQNSAFGQPSALGQNSAFGQPAPQASTSPFGQVSQTTSAFGQPSALGQQTNAFGGASTTATSSSPFATAAATNTQPTNAFGQPQTTSNPSPFAAVGASNTQTTSPFAQQQATSSSGPFSQAATAAPTNPFGQPQQQQQTLPFTNAPPAQSYSNTMDLNSVPAATTGSGAPATAPAAASTSAAAPTPAPTNPFAQVQANNGSGATTSTSAAAPAPNNPFAQVQPPNGFGAPAATPAATNPFAQVQASNTFGAPTATSAPSNPFAQVQTSAGPSSQPTIASSSSAPITTNDPYGPDSDVKHPDVNTYSTRGPDGRLLTWEGSPVIYKMLDGKEEPGFQDTDGKWTRIWFPNGPPPFNKDTEPAAAGMTVAEKESDDAWEHFRKTGRFLPGKFPSMPPRRKDTNWKF